MTQFKAGWHLIYTRPHQERKVCGQLMDKDIQTYLPLVREKRKWNDRIKIIQAPIFPSYVFVYLKSSCDFYEAMRVEGYCYYVRAGAHAARMSDHDIEQIRMMENSGENVEVANNQFQAGQKLVVMNGPLNGLSCEVVQYKGKKRILVRIVILRRSILADLPPSVFF